MRNNQIVILQKRCEQDKEIGNMKMLLHDTRLMLELVDEDDDLARCYRNFGYYFTKKKWYEEAVACFELSLLHADDVGAKKAELTIDYIHEIANREIVPLTFEELFKLGVKYGFPVLLSDFARHFEDLAV